MNTRRIAGTRQVGMALKNARKWRVTANVKYDEEKKTRLTFKWEWGGDAVRRRRRCPPCRRYMNIPRSWGAHMAKKRGKGTTQVGKMDVIPTDSYLDTRINCV